MIFRPGILALAIFVGLTSLASAADSFCVSCSGPTASYVCEVTIPDGVVPTQSPQLYCAYRLASEGKHASCSSRRSGLSACPGDYRQLAYQGPSLVDPDTPTGSIEPPAVLTAPPATELPASQTPPPQTDEGAITPTEEPQPADAEEPHSNSLAELTEQVKEVIGGGAEEEAPAEGKDMARLTDDFGVDAPSAPAEAEPSTGDKIAGAAKTALNCLASWFRECE